MRLPTFFEELKTEQEALAIEVKANPEVSQGIDSLVASQNRDQRVVARSTRNWMRAVRGFIFKRWRMAIAAQDQGRKRIISMLQKKKVPTAKGPFIAWRRLTQQSKSERIHGDLAALCRLADQTREKARECLALEREARETHFNMKQAITSLSRETKESQKKLDSPITSGIALGSVIAALSKAYSVLGSCCERQINAAVDMTYVGSVLCQPRKELRKDIEFGRGMSAQLRKTLLSYLPLSEKVVDLSDAFSEISSIYYSSSDEEDEDADEETGEEEDDDDRKEDDEEGEEEEAEEEDNDDSADESEDNISIKDRKTFGFRRERSEEDPKYWPDTEPFPKKFDFNQDMLKDLWSWDTLRDEPVQALAYKTQTGGAMFEWAMEESNSLREKLKTFELDSRPSGSKSVVAYSASEEDRAARMFQSIWRARAARKEWQNDKHAVLAACIAEREENDAALRFQTAWRGRCARLEWKRDPKGVIRRKIQRESLAAEAKRHMKLNEGLADALDYAVGNGNKAHGALMMLSGEAAENTQQTLVGAWRFKQMQQSGLRALENEEKDEEGEKEDTGEATSTIELALGKRPRIPFSNYQTLGNGRLGYLTSATTKLSVGKTGGKKRFKMPMGNSRLAQRLAFRSGCQREALRFAFLAETFQRVAGKDDIQIVQDVVDRRVKEQKIFRRITEKEDYNLVKAKNRGHMPRRREEEDNFLFLSRIAMQVVAVPPLKCYGQLVHRVQTYNLRSLSDARWVATAQLLASCSSRMIAHWKLSAPLLEGRSAGAIAHRHVSSKVVQDAWRFQGNLLMQRGKAAEDDEDEDIVWVPDTEKISGIFTKISGPFQYDVDDFALMEEQMKSLRYVFEQNGALLKKVFSHYAAAGDEGKSPQPKRGEGKSEDKEESSDANNFTIDRSEMNTFVKEIKILHRHKKRVKNAHVVQAFNIANKDEKADARRASVAANPDLSDDDDENPDDELTPMEFSEVLIRLALRIYGNKTLPGEYAEPWPLSKMVETFFAEDVRPHACAPNKNAMEGALKNPLTIDTFYEHRKMLKKIFDKYAAADQSDAAAKATGSLNLEELKVMVRDAKLMGPTLSDRMLRVLFMGAQGDEGGGGEDAEVGDDSEMDFGEYLEIIAAFVSAWFGIFICVGCFVILSFYSSGVSKFTT
jgi:hypothetical protein